MGITDGVAKGDFVVLFFFWMENGLLSGVLVSEDRVERVLAMMKVLQVSIRKLSVCFN
jgi:hypothetical protein